jgi:hypothetical protein
MGFKSEMIPTSADYCAMRIWPEGNARTHPLRAGNISVSP